MTKTPTLASLISLLSSTSSSYFKFTIFHITQNKNFTWISRSKIPRRERLKLCCVQRSLVQDVYSGKSVHAMHVLDSCCDRDWDVVWVWSIQTWIPQTERHCQLLWFMWPCWTRRRKTLLGLCTATIVLNSWFSCSISFLVP